MKSLALEMRSVRSPSNSSLRQHLGQGSNMFQFTTDPRIEDQVARPFSQVYVIIPMQKEDSS